MSPTIEGPWGRKAQSVVSQIVAVVDELTLHRVQRDGQHQIEIIAKSPECPPSLPPEGRPSLDVLPLGASLLIDYERLDDELLPTHQTHDGPMLLVVDESDEDRAIALLEEDFDEYLLRSELDDESLERALRRARARWEYRQRAERAVAFSRLRQSVAEVIEQERQLAPLGERLCEVLVDGGFRAVWLAIDVPLAPREVFSAGWEHVEELHLDHPANQPPPCIGQVTDPGFAVGADPIADCCRPCYLGLGLREGQLHSVSLERDGQHFGVLCCVMPRGMVAGDLEHEAIAGIASDICGALSVLLTNADLQQITAKLHASEQRFRSAFDSTEVGMGLLDLDGTITEANDALCQFFGRGRDELLGLTFADVTHPLDLHTASRSYADLRKGRRDAFSLEKRYLHGETGATLWGIVSVALVRDTAGHASHFVAHVQDIDQRRRTEEALANSEARYRSYISTSPDGFAVLDQDGCVVELNETLERMSGHRRDGLIGHRLTKLHDEQTSASLGGSERLARLATLAFDAPLSVEMPVLTASGERRMWSIHAARIPEGAMVFCRDITSERQLQSRLAQADRMASIGVLASGVAHEINNPLAFVLLNLEGLTDELNEIFSRTPNLDSRQREEIEERIKDAVIGAQRVRRIVRDLKTFARADEGRRVQTSLAAVLDGAVAMAQNELKYRAELLRDYDPTVPDVVVNDGKLAQVALNLLVNATQAIEEGDRSNNVVELKTFCRDDSVGFSIRDTGKGIEQQRIAHIFEPFVSTKEVGVGSGLGLSICRAIVGGLNGRIEVESKLGEGSCFTVILPRSLAHVRPTRPQSSGTLPAMGSLRVLVIDDEISLGQALERMLWRLDHEPSVVTSGREALKLLAVDDRYDVVLCDMMMPDLSGVDLHRRLLATHPQLASRTIFVTGGAFTPQTAAYLNHVDNLKLEKPFEPADLERALKRAVARAAKARVA